MSDETTYTEDTHVIPIEGDDQVVKIPIFSQLALVVVIFLIIFGSGITAFVFSKQNTTNSQIDMEGQPTTEIHTILEEMPDDETDGFEDVVLSAKAAFVFDVTTQRVLYQKNADEQLPIASITKLMTALLAFETIGDDESVLISDEAFRQDGGNGLAAGESFLRTTLSDLTLMTSSNDGAYALASAAGAKLEKGGDAATFVEAMNIKADELGLTQTYFRNPTGLDVSANEAGAFGSARDMAFLTEYITLNYSQILQATTDSREVFKSQTGSVHAIYNTNQYVDEIPRLIGSKTGYTDLAGGNLVVAFDVAVNRPVVIVVLGSTRSQRFSDVERLVSATLASI